MAAKKKKTAAKKKPAAKKAKPAKKAAPKKAAPKKAAPKKAAKKAAPKKAAPAKAAPTKAAAPVVAPKKPTLTKRAIPAGYSGAGAKAAPGGRFCWWDLMTTDVDAARRFYSTLLPWKTRPVEMQPLGVTQRIEAAGSEIGGLVSLPSSEGITSHWMPYVLVKDIDAVVKKAEQLGGYVPVPPTKLEGVGRFAVIADPRGAHVSPIETDMPAPNGSPGPGQATWNEVVTDDPAASARFFAGVFGWKVQEQDMGPMGTYMMFIDGADQVGGVMKAPDGVTPHFLTYWNVNDIGQSLKRAKQAGANVMMEPTDVPGIGTIAICVDPTGASFALHQPTAA